MGNAAGDHWRDQRIVAAVAEAVRAGAHQLLGAQAIRWNGRRLTCVGQSGVNAAEADGVVVATGHRPLTRAELAIEGARCAGVLPATVALHLLAHEVCLGRHPLVVGGSDWALQAVGGLVRSGARHVTLLAPVGLLLPVGHRLREVLDGPVDVYEGLRPVSIEGNPRVSDLEAATEYGERVRLPCDAVILAHGRVPYRNVDGAITGGPGVVFAQSAADPASVEASEAAGRLAADQALDVAENPRGVEDPPSRIGPTTT